MYDDKFKKEVEIFFKSNETNAAETARKFNIPYTTVKTWVATEKWESGSAIKNIENLGNEVVTKNFNIVTKTAQDKIKNEITQNLGELAFSVENAVLESLLNESSENLLIQAMSLNHINKSLALNAAIAKNALLQLCAQDNGSMQSKMAIVACSEKVGKIFQDLKTSLYGKEVTIIQNAETDYTEASDAELLEIIQKSALNS